MGKRPHSLRVWPFFLYLCEMCMLLALIGSNVITLTLDIKKVHNVEISSVKLQRTKQDTDGCVLLLASVRTHSNQ